MGMIPVGEVLPLKQEQKLTPPQPSPSLREREGAEATPPQPSPWPAAKGRGLILRPARLPRRRLAPSLSRSEGEGWGGVLLLYRF